MVCVSYFASSSNLLRVSGRLGLVPFSCPAALTLSAYLLYSALVDMGIGVRACSALPVSLHRPSSSESVCSSIRCQCREAWVLFCCWERKNHVLMFFFWWNLVAGYICATAALTPKRAPLRSRRPKPAVLDTYYLPPNEPCERQSRSQDSRPVHLPLVPSIAPR